MGAGGGTAGVVICGSGAAVMTRPLGDLPPRARPRPLRLPPRPRDVINAASALASLVSFSAANKQHDTLVFSGRKSMTNSDSDSEIVSWYLVATQQEMAMNN